MWLCGIQTHIMHWFITILCPLPLFIKFKTTKQHPCQFFRSTVELCLLERLSEIHNRNEAEEGRRRMVKLAEAVCPVWRQRGQIEKHMSRLVPVAENEAKLFSSEGYYYWIRYYYRSCKIVLWWPCDHSSTRLYLWVSSKFSSTPLYSLPFLILF